MTAILKSSRNVWCEMQVDGAGLLVDGDDYYKAFYAAAGQAERYILLAGWQFDTEACLLRGTDAQGATLPVTLLEYLDALCDRKPELRVYLLAWDFHAVFALEREWMQKLRFNWSTNERLQFTFDDRHAIDGSHHQKFVVIDGWLSFLGGLDLCEQRWDERSHKDPNPLRVSRGEPHKPFHDIQAYLVGQAVAAELSKLFAHRWQLATGAAIALAEAANARTPYPPPAGAVPLSASRVALSRTDPHGSPDGARGCREICQLHLDAIAAARTLIYIETQYFSSREIGAALARRLSAPDQDPLNVVLVLNMEAETFKEEVAVGLRQAKVIGELRAAAAGTQHRLGIYYTLPTTRPGAEPERATYIHSKLMIIDDRFLTVGSANLTNRSAGVDTELNASFEAGSENDELGRSIRAARLSLLCEHLGVPADEALPAIDLVDFLDGHAERRAGRLRKHPSPTEREQGLLSVIDPEQLPFDPEAPEDMTHDRALFASGLGALWTRLFGSA